MALHNIIQFFSKFTTPRKIKSLGKGVIMWLPGPLMVDPKKGYPNNQNLKAI
jgi:hypothetical protein